MVSPIFYCQNWQVIFDLRPNTPWKPRIHAAIYKDYVWIVLEVLLEVVAAELGIVKMSPSKSNTNDKLLENEVKIRYFMLSWVTSVQFWCVIVAVLKALVREYAASSIKHRHRNRRTHQRVPSLKSVLVCLADRLLLTAFRTRMVCIHV